MARYFVILCAQCGEPTRCTSNGKRVHVSALAHDHTVTTITSEEN